MTNDSALRLLAAQLVAESAPELLTDTQKRLLEAADLGVIDLAVERQRIEEARMVRVLERVWEVIRRMSSREVDRLLAKLEKQR